jgi:2-hydroxychromene-2-carboxylate isomerase
MARLVDFYFGPGSRFAYLASTQLDAISARTSARFRWCPVYSADLMKAAGYAPFEGAHASGQYTPEYRDTDVLRWAALYGVPFHNASLTADRARRYAQAFVAAGDHVEPFARAFYKRLFAEGAPAPDDAGLVALAARAGLTHLDIDALGVTERAAHIIAEAITAGVFGVPSFVIDGEVFWGNDRLVLLEHHLKTTAPG